MSTILAATMAAAFVQGLMGFFHCPGMCGPFAVLLTSSGDSPVVRTFVYNIGRSISYTTVGFVLGLAGQATNAFLLSPAAAVIGGSLVILMALAYLIPGISSASALRTPAALTQFVAAVLKKNRTSAAVTLGMASGLLPCGMLLPAYGLALSTGSPPGAAVVMFAFGLGTFPAMIAIGLGSRRLLQWTGRPLATRWITGGLLLVMGIGIIVTRLLGIDPLHHLHGHP